MGTNAPGQLLGFSLQYPRALLHLLVCDIEDQVCLEVFGDVGVTKEDGSKLTEEDKSSQNSNPVTDRSIDLWKTFFNWVKLAIDGTVDPDNTAFILYANKRGKKGIVDSFHSARNIGSAKKVFQNASRQLKTIDIKHEIYPYLQFLKKNESVLYKIIEKFEFVTGSGSGIVEVRKAIRSKHVSDSQIDFILNNLMGWLQGVVMDKLAKKENAIVSWKEFDVYARPVFERAWKRELIDFTLNYPIQEQELNKHKLERPPYIRQLEAVGSDDDDIQLAVTDFLKAKVNRLKWIEQELIDEPAAREYEEKLTDFWKSQRKTVDITHSQLSDEKKGRLVFHLCRVRQQSIKNQDPPPATTAGTYHLLSNSFSIGWHPKWQETFVKANIKENE